VFLLIKLVLLPLWLPFKIIAEIIEHSGHRRHHRRRHLRVNWLPGTAGLTRWTSDLMRSVGAAEQTPVQRFAVMPIAVLAMILAWAVLASAWLLWWTVLILALPLMLLA
jgi:hypothetical protein